jgi:glycosyltransferase involved in cell wall biosynthesis
MLLTIAIPTYNRKKQLLSRIEEICNCPNAKKIKILVIDNKSDEDPTIEAKHIADQFGVVIEVIRNNVNVGMCANICKCFEVTNTEWMWLLGDDDPIKSDALEQIFDKINLAGESCVLMKFGGNEMIPPVTTITELQGVNQFSCFVDSSWRFSTMLFISNSVFRISSLKKYTHYGYTWSYSLAPHLAIILPAMRDGFATFVFPNSILENSMPENRGGWNEWRLRMGTATLGEIEGCEIFASYSLKKIFDSWMSNFLRSFPAMALRSNDRPISFWQSFLHRVAGISRGKNYCYCIVCAIFMLPLFRFRVLKKITQKYFGLRSDTNNLDRM